MKPAPAVINFLEPFNSCSLKYPVHKKNELLKAYSKPIEYVNSFNSSLNPSGASLKDLNKPDKKLISGCLYAIKSPEEL